jgi:hypothetical protein
VARRRSGASTDLCVAPAFNAIPSRMQNILHESESESESESGREKSKPVAFKTGRIEGQARAQKRLALKTSSHSNPAFRPVVISLSPRPNAKYFRLTTLAPAPSHFRTDSQTCFRSFAVVIDSCVRTRQLTRHPCTLTQGQM